MSVDTLVREEQLENQNSDIGMETATALGATVFEALAVEAETAVEQPMAEEDLKFTNSLTRLGDGQTVPDDR